MTTACMDGAFWALLGSRSASQNLDLSLGLPSAKQEEQSSASALGAAGDERLSRLLAAVEEASAEAGCDDWDGEGSRALREDAIDRAASMIALLPAHMQDPEINVSGLGSLMFDWDKGPDWQLSLALSPRDTISFAGFFRGARSHGEFPFYPERLPDEILAAFKRWPNL